MKCPRCGKENPGTGGFCVSCGSPLGVSVHPGSTRGIEARLAKLFSASPKLLRLLPFSGKIAGLLDLDLMRTINPIVLFVPVAFTFILGLSSSAFGHIENSPFLFQALPIISVFNPFLGYLSAIAFAVGDIIQKLLYDDVYYGVRPTIVDYVGARIGFIISYTSVVTFGVLPGILARVFRNFMTRRQMQGRPLDGGTATTLASIIAFVLGGAIGAAISGVAAIGLEMPSFYMRQSPDVSCANAMITTNVNSTIPTSTASGFVGGIVGPIANSTIPKIFPPTTGEAGQISGIDRLPEKFDWKDFGKGVRFPGVRASGDGGPTVKGILEGVTWTPEGIANGLQTLERTGWIDQTKAEEVRKVLDDFTRSNEALKQIPLTNVTANEKFVTDAGTELNKLKGAWENAKSQIQNTAICVDLIDRVTEIGNRSGKGVTIISADFRPWLDKQEQERMREEDRFIEWKRKQVRDIAWQQVGLRDVEYLRRKGLYGRERIRLKASESPLFSNSMIPSLVDLEARVRVAHESEQEFIRTQGGDIADLARREYREMTGWYPGRYSKKYLDGRPKDKPLVSEPPDGRFIETGPKLPSFGALRSINGGGEFI